MPPAAAPRNVDGSVLRRRLAAVRGQLRFVHLVRGAGWVVGAGLLTLLLAALLDYTWILPGLVRALLLVGAMVGTGVLAVNHLIRPLAGRTDDLTLALKIEEAYPTLNDCLASAVQFLDQEGGGESEAMRNHALRQTLQKSSTCDFFRIVDARGLRLASLTGLLALIAVVTLGALYPMHAATALARLADPFGRHNWPTQTQLAIETPPRRVAINSQLDIRGTVRGVIPAEAKLILSAEGFPVRELPVKILKEREDEGRILFTLPSSQIQRTFRFHVKAHDATSEEFEVSVLPPPSLALLDGKPSPQIRLDYPAYTELPSPRYLPPGIGNIEAIAGTTVTLQGAADRSLARVWIEPRYEPRLPPYLLSLTGSLSGTLLESHLARFIPPVFTAPIEATLAEDGKRFKVVFQPLMAGDYLLHLEDATGLRGSRAFELRVRPDPVPLVTLERPSASKDLLMALPAAELPVQVLVEDTAFGIRSVFLRYRTHRDHPHRTLVIYSEAMAHRRVGLGVGLAMGTTTPHYRPTRLEPRSTLALKRITHPDGKPLKDGDTVFLQAGADDFDAVNPNKEPGLSSEVEIRIVDRNRLELTFNEEQTKIQQEILRQREKQRDILKSIRELKAQTDKGQKLTPEQQRALTEAEQQQGILQDRIGTQKEGLRAEVARLGETLKQNGLKNSPMTDRVADVATELDRIAEKELPKIQSALTEARKAQDRADNPQGNKDAADKLRREAQNALDRAEALKRNDPGALEKAAERRDQEAKEAEAKGAPERARDLQSEAAQLRQQARDLEKNPVDPDQKATRDELARLEAKAQELREAADKIEQQPMVPPQQATQQNLNQAKQGQEEVERTLTDLLARLEPWSTDRELKGEANRLLQEQKELDQKAGNLNQQGLEGRDPQSLTPAQKTDLRNLAEQQQKLEQRANELVQKIKTIADQRQEKDPERAKELKDAAAELQKDNVAGKMQDARNQIDRNKLNDARQSQKAAAQGLDKAVKNLEERREDRFDRLAKKLRETEQQLEKWQDEVERLKKQRQEAEKIGDPQKREQELARLRKEEERLQAKGQDIADNLKRLRAEGGARGLEQAQQKVEEAVKQLQRREDQPPQEQQALDRIEEARQELQQAREQAEEQLAREQLVRVMDTLKALKERQDALIAEARRIQDAVPTSKQIRALQQSMFRLGNDEKGLANETRTVASRELTSAPVFARMVERAADAMIQAGERAPKVVVQPLPPLPDEELRRCQELAARRLEQVIKAVQEEVDAPQLAAPAGGQQPEMGGMEQRPAPGDHIPPLAQLKLLRVLEMDVRQQLLDFRKDHPDLKNLDDKAQARYQELLKQRQDVIELFEELNRPDDEPAPKPEGGKP